MARTMKAGQRIARDERRAMVLRYFAENPRASYRQAAAVLGVPKSTVEGDLKSALADLTARSRDAMVAAMVNRAESIVEAAMPRVLRQGSVAHGSLALAADKQTATLLGLNAPARVEHLHRRIAERVAAEAGLDPDALVAEAERILAEAAG